MTGKAEKTGEKPMVILLWDKEDNRLKMRLQQSLFADQRTDVVVHEVTLEDLQQTILDHRPEIEALILSPKSVDDLTALLELNPLFSGLRVIVLLPDSDREFMALAHHLTPRYMAMVDDDPKHLYAVVLNILRHERGGRFDRPAAI